MVNGVESESITVVSGVPQGSVLGPLLFLIYIDSISLIQLSQNSKLVLYADDILLYKTILTARDYTCLQKDINHIYFWSSSNGMSFNITKCKQMLLSRKCNPTVSVPLLNTDIKGTLACNCNDYLTLFCTLEQNLPDYYLNTNAWTLT